MVQYQTVMVTGCEISMSTTREIQLDSSWLQHLQPEFDSDYMQQLRQFLLQRKQAGAVIYPPGKAIFAALNTTPLDQVKVVIIGQDPYHGPDQAHGLCFSVKPGIAVPPSLLNIYKEVANDTGCGMPSHGYLMPWAEQGVLLLNAVLTVERGQAGAHQNKGWERFTDQIIATVNEQREHVVFLLWGSYAQKKAAMVNTQKHCVLKAPHPSPLSAHRGFLGCQHFSKCNDYLETNGKKPIRWQLD